VKNGRINRFRGDGIRCENRGCEAHDVVATNNLGQGINLGAGVARSVRAANNGDGGIRALSVTNSSAVSNGRRGVTGTIVVDTSVEDTLNADAFTALGILAAQINGALVSQVGIGTGVQVTGQIVNSTVDGGRTAINADNGSAFGNTVKVNGAGAIGITTTSPNAVRQNVVTATGGATSISGNPIAGQNICNGVSC
jgi:hypothetical protein